MAAKKIERLAKGDKARTARHAAVMNEVIDALNIFLGMTLSPPDKGKFIYSDANVVLQLNKNLRLPDPPTSGTYVLGSIDAAVQWLTTEQCECGSIDGGGA